MAKEKENAGLVVVGLARDCALTLNGALALCDCIDMLFSSVDFVFVENSSKDKTRQLLEDWSRRRCNCHVISPTGIDENSSRTARISVCRNAALDLVAQLFLQTTYMLVVDMDLDLQAENAAAIRDAIEFISLRPEIAAVFPNSNPLYYDLFALRHPLWCPTDVWQEVERAWGEWQSDDDHQTPPEDIFVRSRQLRIPSDLPPIRVDSAFGGMGIYRWDLAKSSRYRGIDDKGFVTCEHVEFHRNIHGDKYILPSWRLKAPREHLSSAFRAEYPHERELRKKRDRLELRDRLVKRLPGLRNIIGRMIR